MRVGGGEKHKWRRRRDKIYSMNMFLGRLWSQIWKKCCKNLKRKLIRSLDVCGCVTVPKSRVIRLTAGDPFQCYWPTLRVCKVLTFSGQQSGPPLYWGQINRHTHTYQGPDRRTKRIHTYALDFVRRSLEGISQRVQRWHELKVNWPGGLLKKNGGKRIQEGERGGMGGWEGSRGLRVNWKEKGTLQQWFGVFMCNEVGLRKSWTVVSS